MHFQPETTCRPDSLYTGELSIRYKASVLLDAKTSVATRMTGARFDKLYTMETVVTQNSKLCVTAKAKFFKINNQEVDMPRGNKTGPLGRGPMTGRGFGTCGGNSAQGRGQGGRGLGLGRGAGRGLRRGQAAIADSPDEITALRNQAKNLGDTLAVVNKRIAEIEAGQ
ncbi:MAG: DUF5320 domain-containing protein [Chitinispirillaceae bacterium]|nr:DUF5320 domain-containing protein [Chitinispirillaceae bacterium]